MFRQRKSSAKPGDELLANFRQQFPEVSSGSVSSATGAPAHTTLAGNIAGLVAAPPQERNLNPSQDVFDQDPTPRPSAEPWRFTPSLLDPDSFSFSAFANQPPGYYTPTPGGTNTLYHPQAGDLHTPTLGLGMGLGTPLSLPTSDRGLHVPGVPGPPMMDMSGQHFHHPGLHPQHFQQPFNPFIHPAQQQPSFAPSTFIHQDTGYETMDQDGSPLDSDGTDDHRMRSMDAAFHNSQSPPLLAYPHGQYGVPMSHGLPPSAEKFRFHCTLNAPTAMIKHAEEIPITYLNKGQAYSLSIVDTAPTIPVSHGVKYRTFVRISFEDDQQRQKPGVCWSLWKEGRGTNEAHQRGGKLQAVEYVEQTQSAEGDNKRTRVEVESASFDGFCVVWTPGVNGMAECNIAVRFNFLSTDFSHSKGVKGIPVRLCAKTIPLSGDISPSSTDNGAELCYSKVKLFRDHGAERKLANDVAHVKKSIDKLKQQIAQAESGMKDFGKRKRGGATSLAKGPEGQRPGKVQKHKRTWSMSSASSADGNGHNTRPSAEDDMHLKLQALQDMFTSTRPVSILYLRGEELDDPDLHPVALAGEPTDLTKVDSKEAAVWQARSARESGADSSVLVSPSPSSLSLQSQQSAVRSHPWEPRQERPTRVATKTDEEGNLSGWIEALGVDPAYQPPVDCPPKPVACFYVARQAPAVGERSYHRAIYLASRTLHDFVLRTAAKWSIDANAVVRALHVLDGGLEIEMDDDVIRELAEGQAMALEIREVEKKIAQPKREWEMAVDAPDGEKDSTSSAYRTVTEFELRFTF
ncbi:CP2 transcription factor-domain-containing protein [Microdochium bolleyi]|uniref:CP2 transcription factor-domain-containing protein n=1 Tax=Microdochium bolleyi TaxID=196109 RepID=A0A136IZA6_9PEZI|nr:CP2 transcription factor-domain-containing protein [Microdochium bolleyi]